MLLLFTTAFCFTFIISLIPLLSYALHCSPHLLGTNHKCTHPCNKSAQKKKTTSKVMTFTRSSRRAVPPVDCLCVMESSATISLSKDILWYLCNSRPIKVIYSWHWYLCTSLLSRMCETWSWRTYGYCTPILLKIGCDKVVPEPCRP